MLRYSLTILFVSAAGASAGEPVPAVKWDEAAARHLLSRACFGGTPDQAKALAALPQDKAVDRLLDEAATTEPLPKPEWVRDVWVNTLRRYSDMSREEYLVTFRRTTSTARPTTRTCPPHFTPTSTRTATAIIFGTARASGTGSPISAAPRPPC